MSSDEPDDSAPGGESSADYIISESDKQSKQQNFSERTRHKKSDLESVADSIKDKATGTAKSIKEGMTSAVGDGGSTDELESAQVNQREIGEAESDPSSAGPTENLREKAAETVEDDDSAEPA